MADSTGSIYILLLIALAVVAAFGAEVVALASATIRNQQLADLRWRGMQYSNAIGAYYEATPGSQRVFPRTMSELEQDSRYLSIRRHLRELYESPIPKDQWEVVRAPDGGIQGVRSKLTQLEFVFKPDH